MLGVCIVCSAGLERVNSAESALSTTSTASTNQAALSPPLEAQYERLSPDASWCGPRVLYFFSVYLGKPCPLEEVVAHCRPDDKGLTSLADLARVAGLLGLTPTPVRCTIADLEDFNGPAIVSVSREHTGPVHFVGVLRRESDAFVVLDPSVSVRTYRVSRSFLERSFTGHAILLGEAGRTRGRSLSNAALTMIAGFCAVATLMYLRPVWLRRAGRALRTSFGGRNDALPL